MRKLCKFLGFSFSLSLSIYLFQYRSEQREMVDVSIIIISSINPNDTPIFTDAPAPFLFAPPPSLNRRSGGRKKQLASKEDTF